MNSPLPDELLGAWRLVSFEDRDTEDDEWEQPFPPETQGALICDRSGMVSLHVHAPSADSSGDPAYVGYFGLGEVHDVVRTDESVRGTLTLDLLGGHPAEVLEDNPPRPFVRL